MILKTGRHKKKKLPCPKELITSWKKWRNNPNRFLKEIAEKQKHFQLTMRPKSVLGSHDFFNRSSPLWVISLFLIIHGLISDLLHLLVINSVLQPFQTTLIKSNNCIADFFYVSRDDNIVFISLILVPQAKHYLKKWFSLSEILRHGVKDKNSIHLTN